MSMELPNNADVWLLAGQSNMAGSGNCDAALGEAYEAPAANVFVYALNDEWRSAEEPFQIDRPCAVDEAFAIMRGDRNRGRTAWDDEAAEAFQQAARANKSGAGLGTSFGNAMAAHTGRPVGLLYCAKGDTRMEEWRPDYDGHPYMALYAATMRRIRKVNRKLAGVVWYQGESDTFDGKGDLYAERMEALVTALRSDCGQPNLPFYYVQLAACYSQPSHELPQWDLVRWEQRRLESILAPGGVCTAIDLPLTDGIHLSPTGQQRLGQRLAKLARIGQYDDTSLQVGPRLSQIERVEACVIRVHFANVNGRLGPSDRVTGFAIREPDGSHNLLCSQQVEADTPNVIRLRASFPFTEGCTLTYGQGIDVFANLVDQQDMGALAFGPQPIPML